MFETITGTINLLFWIGVALVVLFVLASIWYFISDMFRSATDEPEQDSEPVCMSSQCIDRRARKGDDVFCACR